MGIPKFLCMVLKIAAKIIFTVCELRVRNHYSEMGDPGDNNSACHDLGKIAHYTKMNIGSIMYRFALGKNFTDGEACPT